MDEISAVDGETDYYPAQKAVHRMIGLEHEYAGGINLRLEVYAKAYSRLRPAFRNSFEDIIMFPEHEVDRTVVYREQADSRGIEIYLKRDSGGKLSWWLTYAYAKAEDSVRYLYYPAEDLREDYWGTIPTPNDQRHTFYCDLQYRPTPRWQCALAFQYHTGWPYTGIKIVSYMTPEGIVYGTARGTPWGERYDAFQRLDIRVNRYFPLGRGRIIAFTEVLNILGQKNVRSYDYVFHGGPDGPVLLKSANHWLGIIPSFGVSYEMEF